MGKIFVDKDDPAASVIEKIIAAEDSEVVLVVPKSSSLRSSISNFHLIKREAEALEKDVIFESVDDEVLALAKASGMRATHSFFRQDQFRHSLSDIVPRDQGSKKENFTSERGKPTALKKDKKEEKPKDDKKILSRKEELREEDYKPHHAEVRHKKGRLPKYLAAFTIVLVVLLGITALILTTFFDKATVVIALEKYPWGYEGNFVADKTAGKINFEKNLIPAQFFQSQKNLAQTFRASGRDGVSEKAKGVITIYNAYSVSPQQLIATTRFVTPDNKIFRLDKAVSVPGAKSVGGKLTPSSVQGAVTADKAGAEYNVGAVGRLSIPGFKGSPKYDNFYGALAEGANGGFVGEKAVPTDKDIAAAKDRTSEILKTVLRSNIFGTIPKNLKILDEAMDIQITKLAVNKSTDNEGNFSVLGEAKLAILAFRESDLSAILTSFALKERPDTVFHKLGMQYGEVKPNFKNGTVGFRIKADGSLKTAFDENRFRNEILMKKINDIRPLLVGVKGIKSVAISLWPIWISRVPMEPERVEVVLEVR